MNKREFLSCKVSSVSKSMQLIDKVLEQGILELNHNGFFHSYIWEMYIFTNISFSQMFSFI